MSKKTEAQKYTAILTETALEVNHWIYGYFKRQKAVDIDTQIPLQKTWRLKPMDVKTCLQKLQYVGVLAFATVDEQGTPQVRNISAIHYEPDAIYFFTARGKNFCKELLADGRVQILGYTKYKEMIRLSTKAVPAPQDEQRKWMDTIFAEQPYLSNVYPGETKEIGIMKVIGASLKDIRRLFLTEAAFIGFAGGVLGSILSLATSKIVNIVAAGQGSTMQSYIPLWLYLSAILFATAVGIAAGFLPAQRAMKLSALTAIKTE